MFAFTGLDSKVCSSNYTVLEPCGVFECGGLRVMELSRLIEHPS